MAPFYYLFAQVLKISMFIISVRESVNFKEPCNYRFTVASFYYLSTQVLKISMFIILKIVISLLQENNVGIIRNNSVQFRMLFSGISNSVMVMDQTSVIE